MRFENQISGKNSQAPMIQEQFYYLFYCHESLGEEAGGEGIPPRLKEG
jgi:hypothetical protein